MPVGLAPLPEGAGRPHAVLRERLVRDGVHARELGVEIVHEAPQLRHLPVDLAREERHVGREIDAPPRGEELEHRRARLRAAAPRLRLRELHDDARPRRRARGEERESAAAERELAEPVPRRPLPLAHEEHREIAPQSRAHAASWGHAVRRGHAASGGHAVRRGRAASARVRA